jgi:hypothetical protein
MKAPELQVRQIGVTLTQVFDRLVHPLELIFLTSLQNTAAVDVAEQLVPRAIQ